MRVEGAVGLYSEKSENVPKKGSKRVSNSEHAAGPDNDRCLVNVAHVSIEICPGYSKYGYIGA